MGVKILGTSAENVDAAEDRELFDEILEKTEIPRAAGDTVYTAQEAKAAESFGFPEFLPFEETGLALTEEETNDKETFGYWCRDVRGSEDCADIQRKI